MMMTMTMMMMMMVMVMVMMMGMMMNVVVITATVINSTKHWGFPGGAVVENLPANAGDMGSSPGLGRSHMPRSN